MEATDPRFNKAMGIARRMAAVATTLAPAARWGSLASLILAWSAWMMLVWPFDGGPHWTIVLIGLLVFSIPALLLFHLSWALSNLIAIPGVLQSALAGVKDVVSSGEAAAAAEIALEEGEAGFDAADSKSSSLLAVFAGGRQLRTLLLSLRAPSLTFGPLINPIYLLAVFGAVVVTGVFGVIVVAVASLRLAF